VTCRPPLRRVLLPRRHDQATLSEPDEDRIDRARLEIEPAAQVIAVAPALRLRGEREQDGESLGDGRRRRFTDNNIYLVSYA
jgi:hypothetical protein